jgi:diadenosine tetraphosphatase ApaH/serine/threonine PP2A family protein phosphatase
MRYGIFSDIHSNLEALETVLRDSASERVDRFFCTGDIVGYGADPAECIRRIRELRAMTIAGNHDWAVAGVIRPEAFNPVARAAVFWTRSRLDPADTKFLEALRLVHQDDCCTFVHGSLNDPDEFIYLFDPGAAEESFDLMKTQLCFVGHTHVAGIFIQERKGAVRVDAGEAPFTLEKGKRYIVNPGAVGQPRDGDPRAGYCIFDTDAGRIEIRRVAYDVTAARAKIIAAGLPEFLGDRLVYGR